jgi:hypothetical protein
MQITVDTKKDSKEDIMHAIALLEKYVETEKAYFDSMKKKVEVSNPDTIAGFASMMGVAPKEEKKIEEDDDEEETPQIVEY